MFPLPLLTILLALVPPALAVSVGPETPLVVATAGESQTHPDIARAGSHEVTAWVNPLRNRLDAVIDGRRVEVATLTDTYPAPHVAMSDSWTALAWFQYRQGFGDGAIYVRRYSYAGTPLDSAAVEIGRVGPHFAIASDGGRLFVGATNPDTGYRLYTISTAGLLEGDRQVEDGGAAYSITSAAIFPAVPEPIVAAHRDFTQGICDPFGCWTSTFGTVEPRQGGELAFSPATGEFGFAGPFDAVDGGDRITMLWWSDMWLFSGSKRPLYAVQIDRVTRRPLAASMVVLQFGTPAGGNVLGTPHAAFAGGEIVVVFRSTRPPTQGLYGLRLSSAGVLIEGPFLIQPGAIEDEPALAVEGDKVIVVYSRSDGGVARAFRHTIERIEPPLRRRAARR